MESNKGSLVKSHPTPDTLNKNIIVNHMKFYAEMFELDEGCSYTFFATEYETYSVTLRIPLNVNQYIVVGFNPSSTLYPEYVGDNKDLYMGHCNWYIWTKPKNRDSNNDIR